MGTITTISGLLFPLHSLRFLAKTYSALYLPLNIKILAFYLIPKGLSQGRAKNVLFLLLEIALVSL